MRSKWLFTFFLITHLWLSGFNQVTTIMSYEYQRLATKIASLDYPSVIYGPAYDDLAAEEQALQAIVRSNDAQPRVRFLAAEWLRKAGKLNLQEANVDALAEAYCQALLTCTSEDGFSLGLAGNAWGYLWLNDEPGLGQVLIDMGFASIPALKRLAGHSEFVLYEGSREATTGAALKPRAKDFAAYYLHRITGIATRPIALGDRDMEARDAAIDQLLSSLRN